MPIIPTFSLIEPVATFETRDWAKLDKIDDPSFPPVPESELYKYVGGAFGNAVAKSFRQLNQVLNGELAIPDLDVDGTLDVGGHVIIGGNLEVDGVLSTDSFAFPAADGTNGQVLTTDGLGNLSFSGTVGDLTVGDLVASGLAYPTSDGTAGQVIVTDGLGNLSFASAPGGDIVGPATSTNTAVPRWDGTGGDSLLNSGVLIDASNNVTIPGSLTASGLAYPSTDGTAGQVLVTDGAGSLSFVAPTGGLDGPATSTNTAIARWDGTDGDALLDSGVTIDASNNVTIPGTLTADGLAYPTSDGTAGQVLVTDGLGTLSFDDVLPAGSTEGNTLHWSGSAWVQTARFRTFASPASARVEHINNHAYFEARGDINYSVFLGRWQSEAILGLERPTGEPAVIHFPPEASSNAWNYVDGSQRIVRLGGQDELRFQRHDGTGWVDALVVTDDAAPKIEIPNHLDVGTLTAAGLDYPTTDGTAGQVLVTDGLGTLSFGDLPEGDVSGPATSTNTAVPRWDGTGGDALLDSGVLIDVSDNVTIPGTLTAAGLDYPTADGTAGQVLVTDGSGNLSFDDAPASIADGTAVSTTLRWDGTNWVENTGLSHNGTTQLLNGTGTNNSQIILRAGATSSVSWADIRKGGTAVGDRKWWGQVHQTNHHFFLSRRDASTGAEIDIPFEIKHDTGETHLTELVAGGLVYPTSDGTAGQVLVTDGAGNLSFDDAPGGIADGTSVHATLRWDGSEWSQNTNLLASTTQVTINSNNTSTARFRARQSDVSHYAEVGQLVDDAYLALNRGTGMGAQVVFTPENTSTVATSGSLRIRREISENELRVQRHDGTGWVDALVVTDEAAPKIEIPGGLTVDELTYPSADSTDGTILRTDGFGNLGFTQNVHTQVDGAHISLGDDVESRSKIWSTHGNDIALSTGANTLISQSFLSRIPESTSGWLIVTGTCRIATDTSSTGVEVIHEIFAVARGTGNIVPTSIRVDEGGTIADLTLSINIASNNVQLIGTFGTSGPPTVHAAMTVRWQTTFPATA